MSEMQTRPSQQFGPSMPPTQQYSPTAAHWPCGEPSEVADDGVAMAAAVVMP